VRRGTAIAPRLVGGGQERDLRSGTHNVAGIAGMAAAATITAEHRKATVDRVTRLRDRLADGVTTLPGVVETVGRPAKIAGSCHVCVDGVEAEALLFLLEEAGVLAAAGSSCSSGAQEPSHVLSAMGVPRALALGAVRFSLGVTTTDADVDLALAAMPSAVERLRGAGS
jgi:cysteine desulfurase